MGDQNKNVPPVCPICQSNACLVDPDTFARTHLSDDERKYYFALKQAMSSYIAFKMIEHQTKIEKGEVQ